jgi:hypothetical protein
MKGANNDIKRHASSRSSDFDTTARKHVVRMATVLSRSFAKSRVQVAQLSDLQRLVYTRKQRQSSKHKILRGETILATLEMLQCVEVTEAATQSRQGKKAKLMHPSTTPPPNINPTLVLYSLGSNSSEDIADCIIVAFT